MKEYNALLGEKINLEKAKELLQLAIKNEQTYLAEVLRNSIEIARENGIETFEIITPFIEQVNASFLNAIEQLPSYISNEDVQGLNASVSSDDIYNMITNKMIERMKIVTGKGFKKKWDSNRALHIKGFLTPMNFVSGKSYRGVNFFLLKDFDIFKVFDNPYFLTFKQIKELKGKVKKGAKANKIIYFTRLWKIHIKSKEGNIIIDFGTYDHKRFKKYIEDNWHKIEPHTTYSEETLKSTYIPILKYFNVFNGEDVEGIDFKLENLKTGKLEEDSSMQLPKAIVKHYPTPQPKIIHGGDKAAYYFNKDTIQMPHEVAFETIQDYYRVLFHELSHSTGDDRRLNREQSGYRQNQKLYAFEELIAEFGAVFLSAQGGFLWQSDKNHAEYVKHWAMHLKIAEEDNRYIMRAASAAQKSTDYILNLDKDGNPAYLKDLSTEKGEEPSSSKTTHSAKLNKTYIKEKFINDLPDLQTVTNSYQWVSFDPPSRAKREIEDWANWLHEVYNEYSEKAIQENRIDEFHTRFDKYYKRLLKRKKDVIKTRTGTASAAVTGGANFNTNKERAKHDRLHEVEGDYYKYQKYFINKLESVIYEKAGIKSGETDTIIKLEKELEKAQEEHKLNLEVSKAARAYIKNKDKKVLEKFKLPDAVKEKIISDVNRLGYSLHPSSANSSAKIRRIKKRIKAEESRKKKYEDGNKITKFSDFHVIENVDENLLQLIFADKPSEEVRDEIKRHSFRWSRKNSSWQRQLTNNAIFDVKRLIPKLKEIYSAEKGLNAPRHSGKAKEALTECGRLKPGYKYIKGGEIVKVGKTKQGALFGLIATAEHEEINTPKESKLPNVRNILDSPAESEFFKIPGAVGEFLQQVEKKPRHSVVITMDGQQGAGKTTTLYRFLDSFASTKKPCVFFSLEEHPESHLARKKAQEYINPENAPYVDAVGEVQSKEELYKIVDNYDFIFIDSWQKLIRAIGNIKLDEDLRMKFDGKVFVIIFQQTTTGRTKGGADIVFDGDIIIKLIKESKFSDNYAYMDKNRYAITDIADILYNVAGDYTYSPNEALGSDSEHNEVKLLYDFEVN